MIIIFALIAEQRCVRRRTMTDSEQNMVNRLKILVSRMILDLDDEMVLEIIKKAVNKEEENVTR